MAITTYASRPSPCSASAEAGGGATRRAGRRGTAIAQRVPRRAALAAGAAAADLAVADLDREAPDDALGGRLLERGSPLDRDAADARVLEGEPAQDRRDAPRLLGLVERRVAQAGRVEQELEQVALVAVAGDGEGEHAEDLGAVRVDRGVGELPRVLEPEAPTALAEVPLDDREPPADRLQRLDREPVLVRPVARRDAVPRGERGVEVARVVDAEVAEAGPIRASSTIR